MYQQQYIVIILFVLIERHDTIFTIIDMIILATKIVTDRIESNRMAYLQSANRITPFCVGRHFSNPKCPGIKPVWSRNSISPHIIPLINWYCNKSSTESNHVTATAAISPENCLRHVSSALFFLIQQLFHSIYSERKLGTKINNWKIPATVFGGFRLLSNVVSI